MKPNLPALAASIVRLLPELQADCPQNAADTIQGMIENELCIVRGYCPKPYAIELMTPEQIDALAENL